MRRFRVPEIGIGFLAGIAIWATVTAVCPNNNSNQNQPNQATATTRDDNSEHGESLWERTTKDPTAFFTFWVAAFTFVLATSTIGLWIETSRAGRRQSSDNAASVAETRRIGEAQVRAYVDITQVRVILLMPQAVGAGETTLVKVLAKNTGQSPARNFLWHPTIQFVSSSKPGVSHELAMGGNWREMNGIGIAVGDQHEDGAMLDRPPLTQLGSGALGMVIRARIDFEFEDVFGVRHIEEAYFAGVFVRKNMGFDRTEYGPTQWEGTLQRLHRPKDWPSGNGQKT